MGIDSLQHRLASDARAWRGRGGARATLVAIAAVVVSLAGFASQAVSRTGSVPTLNATSTFVVFNQHVKLTGTASDRRVTLFARRFGESAYHRVATVRVHNGRFTFSPVPGLATSYKVAEGTSSTPASRPVRIYVHLDVTRFTCSLCVPSPAAGNQRLRYGLVIRVPSADYRFVRSEPVYLYVGTSTGKVSTETRVGRVKPVGLGHSTVRVGGTIPVDVPAGGRVKFTACDRSFERRTGVGLPSVHDCGDPRLNRRQFKGYVG